VDDLKTGFKIDPGSHDDVINACPRERGAYVVKTGSADQLDIR
jgi:hypothetical protein